LDDFIAWSYTYNAQVMTLKPTGNIGIGNTTPSGKLHVEVGNASRIGVIVRGFTSQTANLTEWQNSSNTVIARVNASGEFFWITFIRYCYIWSNSFRQYRQLPSFIWGSHKW